MEEAQKSSPNNFAFMLGVMQTIEGLKLRPELFAEACGIPTELLNQIKKGKRPSDETMETICKNLKIDYDVATKMLDDQRPCSVAQMYTELHPEIYVYFRHEDDQYYHLEYSLRCIIFTTLITMFQINPKEYTMFLMQYYPYWFKDYSEKKKKDVINAYERMFDRISDIEAEDKNNDPLYDHITALFKKCGLLRKSKDDRKAWEMCMDEICGDNYIYNRERFGNFSRSTIAKAIAQYLIDKHLV